MYTNNLKGIELITYINVIRKLEGYQFNKKTYNHVTSSTQKKEIRQPAFTAIYVWMDENEEEFETYVKNHLMLTLGWAVNNNELKEMIQLNQGNADKVTRELITIFKKELDGNISYLQDILGVEMAQLMVELIKSFIATTVINNSSQFYQHA